LPKYIYFCAECETDFEIKHSLQEVHTKCENCGSDNSLERKPSRIFLAKKQGQLVGTFRDGAVVIDAIEEARQDLKQDQNNLKNREYKK